MSLFATLPIELQSEIFAYCPEDQGRIALVCKAWLQAVSRPAARRPLMRQLYGVTDLSELGSAVRSVQPQIHWRSVSDQTPLPFRTVLPCVRPGLLNGRAVVAGSLDKGIAVYETDTQERLAFFAFEEGLSVPCGWIADEGNKLLLFRGSDSRPVLWDPKNDNIEPLPPLGSESVPVGTVSWRGVPSLVYDKASLVGTCVRPLRGGPEIRLPRTHRVQGNVIIGASSFSRASRPHFRLSYYDATTGSGPHQFDGEGTITDYAIVTTGENLCVAILFKPDNRSEEDACHLELRSFEDGDLIERLYTDYRQDSRLVVATEGRVAFLHALTPAASGVSVRSWHLLDGRLREVSSLTLASEFSEPSSSLPRAPFYGINRLFLPTEEGWQSFEPVALPAKEVSSSHGAYPSSSSFSASESQSAMSKHSEPELLREASSNSLPLLAALVSVAALGILGSALLHRRGAWQVA